MAHRRVLISLTRGADDPDRATVAFVMANAAAALDKDTVVLLSTDGVWVGLPEHIDAIREEGFAPLAELVHTLLQAGGQIWACTPCVKKRGLEGRLHPAIQPVGAVAAIEFVSDNGVSLSF
jgi:predicted peroxiredoxin